jgi:nicotinamide-nucleotide amidase
MGGIAMTIAMEKIIGDYLRERKFTLSVAESCTGGLISDRITDVSGSSDYFQGGIVTYSIQAKARYLGIPLSYIKKYGVVSPQVAKRMAEGVRKAFHTTFGLSVTGVAGPMGGTPKTPVGTVFVGFSDGRVTLAMEEHFKGTRRKIKERAAERCLIILLDHLKENEPKRKK